jgi:GTP1/Obg family GTP-binding protein
MGIVEEVRQIFQDFLAPELRALSTRLDASDKVAESRHNELLSKIQLVDQKVEYLVKEAISRIASAESNLQTRIESLIAATNVEKRLDRLEGLRTAVLAPETSEQKRA